MSLPSLYLIKSGYVSNAVFELFSLTELFKYITLSLNSAIIALKLFKSSVTRKILS